MRAVVLMLSALVLCSGSAIADSPGTGSDANACVSTDATLAGVYVGNTCNFPITFKYCIASPTMTCTPARYLTWMHVLGPNQVVRVMYNQFKETRVQFFACRSPMAPKELRRLDPRDPLYHTAPASLLFTCS
jgi:hypothetical protein